MDYKVFLFKMFFNGDYLPEDRQERYVLATTEDEAIEKFNQYLLRQEAEGFARPTAYSFSPTVELEHVIV